MSLPCNLGNRDNSVEPHVWQILMSSSYTSSTHRWLGISRSLIWGLTSRSKAISGTNKLGRGPVEFRMAVRISRAERLDVGSTDSRELPKTELKM